MIRWDQRTALVTGLLLVVLSNAVALSGVYYNRSGEADAQVTLSERELRLPYSYGFQNENSGIALELNWRIDDPKYSYASHWGEPGWLDASKLTELGFDTLVPAEDNTAHDHYRKLLPREVLVVLELAGPAWQARIKRLQTELSEKQQVASEHPDNKKHQAEVKSTRDQMDNETNSYSRLFAIDAGLDADVLRQKYPDRSKYIITYGQVKARHYIASGNKQAYLGGYIKELSINSINTPYRIREQLEPHMDKQRNQSSKDRLQYQVTVSYGKRLEPWIEDISIE